MKKLVVLSLFCLFSVVTMAQSFPISIGIHGGWNDTKIKVKDLKVESHGGYMFGAYVRVNFGKIYLEPALNFAHKETQAKDKATNEKRNLKYSSIDIPVMVGYYLLKLPVVKLRGFVGPVASFITKDVKIKGLSKDYFDTDKMMWNGKVGAGVDVWKVTFDVDYEFGLKKFGDGVKAPSTVNLTLGFKII